MRNFEAGPLNFTGNSVWENLTNKAFRVTGEEGDVTIEPITSVEHVYLRDLVGYERQKKKLVENTEAFIEGREANNVLLFGDSGTGKSSEH